ncbi:MULTISPECIES: GAF domain-containing sensor histidine kinase [Bacillus]|uniref:histidine kinase n=2 Tax=Bacillus TaxID=1386 RepID=A0A0M3R8Z3_9BACI|nr:MULTISPECIES: GAF domain-containing sensor histidine kinase [Bacillus]ALC80526.1 histidine kinase [Bacillus gobiensis]MBP1083602.1 two-component system NarL family sensor kinase [Bacillus capparidis]MED1094795.1 GAF domain-containing sensor histidine kinase [Bacillus capparidis]
MSESPSELKTLKEIAETLNQGNDLQIVLNEVLKKLLDLTGFKTGWIFLVADNGTFELAAHSALPEALSWENCRLMCDSNCYCIDQYWNGRLKSATNIINCERIYHAIKQKTGDTEGITHHATVPLRDQKKRFGLLNVASPNKNQYSEKELALLEAVALQIGTAVKRIRLSEIEQQNVVLKERNRLAQDLHDSVNQILFSISLTAKAARETTLDESLLEQLNFIQLLSRDALAEMKSLIWELRSEGLKNGIVEAIENYASLIGLPVELTVTGSIALSAKEEELIWRITQEALNNCKKHSQADKAFVTIISLKGQLLLEIEDFGIGFRYDPDAQIHSLGIKGMEDRTKKYGGKFSVKTAKNKGTKIRVALPIISPEKEEKGS